MCREMKDSGVEWIGEIPQHWNIKKHKYVMFKRKDICSKYNREDILSLTMKGVIVRDLENPSGKMPTTFDGYQRVCKDNLLLCLFDIDVTPRCVGLIKNDGLTSPAYSQFIMKENNNPQYYNYLLTSIDDKKCFVHLSKNLRSSLTEDDFGALVTVMPPLEEQKNIVNYLDKKLSQIDDIISKQKSLIEKYKAYKQSLITETVTKGLNKNVPMKDSGIEWIGEIPFHWNICKMKNIGEAIIGLTYSPEDVSSSGTLVLRSSNVQNSKISYEDNVFVNKQISEKLLTREGDILICSRNGSRALIGKCAYIDELSAGNSFGAFMTIFRSEYNKFIFYILNSAIFKFHIGTFLTSTINQLTTTNLSGIEITLPSKDEQNEIADFLDKKCTIIDSAIFKKEQLIEKLEVYKKSLIYECVTGKREVN